MSKEYLDVIDECGIPTAETAGPKKYNDTVVVSVDQMRRSDAYTIEHYVSGRELMYRAAYGVFQAYAAWSGKPIAILVGGGNNGGDGYALAGILMENGIPSSLFIQKNSMIRSKPRGVNMPSSSLHAQGKNSSYGVYLNNVTGKLKKQGTLHVIYFRYDSVN